MYTKEQLTEEVVKVELNKQAATDQEKYSGQSRMQELLEEQYESSKYEVVTSIKVDEKTSSDTIESFGRLCGTMSNVSFNVTYGNSNLEARRPRNMEERVGDIVSSERYRRQQQNRHEQEVIAEHVDDPNGENWEDKII